MGGGKRCPDYKRGIFILTVQCGFCQISRLHNTCVPVFNLKGFVRRILTRFSREEHMSFSWSQRGKAPLFPRCATL